MNIVWDGNWDKPEIEIVDSKQGMIKRGELLINVTEDFTIYAEQKKG